MPQNHRTLSRITNCVIVSLCIYDEKIKSIQVECFFNFFFQWHFNKKVRKMSCTIERERERGTHTHKHTQMAFMPDYSMQIHVGFLMRFFQFNVFRCWGVYHFMHPHSSILLHDTNQAAA